MRTLADLHRIPLPRLVAALLTAGLLVAACGGGGSASERQDTGCGPDQQERVDPASVNHVFAGAPEPAYLTDPPTSGPHEPGPVRSGVLDAPLTRPQQVGQLEAGGVLLQHGDLPADQLAALQALAGDQVAVAPNPELPAPIVATAWTRKMVCQTVDTDALTVFVDAHRGGGPGTDG